MTNYGTRLALTAIGVADLEHSLRFYCAGLGFEPSLKDMRLRGKPEDPEGVVRNGRIRFLRREGLWLELIEYDLPPSERVAAPPTVHLGLLHLNIKTTDVMNHAKQLETLGGIVDWKSRQVFELGDGKTCMLIFLKDPDGTTIELNDIPTFTNLFATP